MTEEPKERRTPNGKQRANRLAASGISAPLAIVITWLITNHMETEMSDEVLIALSTLIGSAVTATTVCFYDIRAILLSRLNRRDVDKRRR